MRSLRIPAPCATLFSLQIGCVTVTLFMFFLLKGFGTNPADPASTQPGVSAVLLLMVVCGLLLLAGLLLGGVMLIVEMICKEPPSSWMYLCLSAPAITLVALGVCGLYEAADLDILPPECMPLLWLALVGLAMIATQGLQTYSARTRIPSEVSLAAAMAQFTAIAVPIFFSLH